MPRRSNLPSLGKDYSVVSWKSPSKLLQTISANLGNGLTLSLFYPKDTLTKISNCPNLTMVKLKSSSELPCSCWTSVYGLWQHMQQNLRTKQRRYKGVINKTCVKQWQTIYTLPPNWAVFEITPWIRRQNCWTGAVFTFLEQPEKNSYLEANSSAHDLTKTPQIAKKVHKDETELPTESYRITIRSRRITQHFSRKRREECQISQKFLCGSESLNPNNCLPAYFEDSHSSTAAQFLGQRMQPK